MKLYNTKQQIHTSEGVEQHGFEFKDSKGREIGALVRQGVSVYETAEHPNVQSEYAAGTYLTAYVHSTRGGERFGASGRYKLFKIEGHDGEISASKARSLWVDNQLNDMKAKQKARNAA